MFYDALEDMDDDLKEFVSTLVAEAVTMKMESRNTMKDS